MHLEDELSTISKQAGLPSSNKVVESGSFSKRVKSCFVRRRSITLHTECDMERTSLKLPPVNVLSTRSNDTRVNYKVAAGATVDCDGVNVETDFLNVRWQGWVA